MSSIHLSNVSHRSIYTRWFGICLMVYAVACTLICVYLANLLIVKNDYSMTDNTSKEIGRRVRDLSVTNQQIDGVKVACQAVPRTELRKKLGPAFIPRYMAEDKPEVEGANGIIEESKTGSVQSDQKSNTRKEPALSFYVNPEFSKILFDDLETSLEVDHVPSILEERDNFNKMVTENVLKETTNTNKIHRHRHNHGYVKKTEELDAFEGSKSAGISKKFIQMVIPDHTRLKRSFEGGLNWLCKSEIEWRDLGPDYFPRYLRTVSCTQAKCWWNYFPCHPKAFTVKVLRRIKNACFEKLTSETLYENGAVPRELREQWVFEERAVTFCCECGN